MNDAPDQYAPRQFRVINREPAPEPRSPQQVASDLAQLAGWLNTISFLDLMELAKSIVDSEKDPSVPDDVKLAKALATWARKTIEARP